MRTLPRPKNNREALANAWRWFITDHHRPGYDAGTGMCQYRTVNPATACAIGCQLPDRLVPLINPGIQGLLEANAELQKYFAGCTVVFLKRLQEAHDQAATHHPKSVAGFREEAEKNFRALARRYHIRIKDIIT